MKRLVTIQYGRRTARAAQLVLLSAGLAFLALMIQDGSIPLHADERSPKPPGQRKSEPLRIVLKADGEVRIGDKRESVREPKRLTERIKKAWSEKRTTNRVHLVIDGEVVYKDIQVVLNSLWDARAAHVQLYQASAAEEVSVLEVQLPSKNTKPDESSAKEPEPALPVPRAIVRQGPKDPTEISISTERGVIRGRVSKLKDLEKSLRDQLRDGVAKEIWISGEDHLKWNSLAQVVAVYRRCGYMVRMPTPYTEEELDLSQIKLGDEDEFKVPGEDDPNTSKRPGDRPPTQIPPPPGTGGGGSLGGDTMPSLYAGRTGATRRKLLEQAGGNAASEAAVARGLKWLALHQATDGHWSLNEFHRHAREHPLPGGKTFVCDCKSGTKRQNDVGATALALLPFLGAGYTHKPPAGNKGTDYSKTVAVGLRWLMTKQDKDGAFGREMYAHGIASIVMCEAYGLTSDPMLKNSAQKALNFIVKAQDPSGGGWRYLPRTPGDVSVTGWQFMAIKSGQMAGLTVPKATLRLAEKFLDSCEVAKPKPGGYSYVPGAGETVTMTAVGLLCRQYSGVNPRNPGLQFGVQRLRTSPPRSNFNLYYLYYATQVMHHMGGEDWEFWNEGKPKGTGIRDMLIKKQSLGTGKNNHLAGSWEPSGSGCEEGGRIMSTSLSILCLEVYYRHLPLFRRDMSR